MSVNLFYLKAFYDLLKWQVILDLINSSIIFFFYKA